MRHWLVVLFVVTVALLIPVAEAAEVTPPIASSPICYLQFDGPSGRIEDDTQSKEIEGLRITYGISSGAGVSQRSSAMAGGRIQPESLVITKMVSASTPRLFQTLMGGRPSRSARVNFVRPTAEGRPAVYYTLLLENVMISSIHQFSDGTRLLEDVSLTASKVSIEYFGQKGKTEFKHDFQQQR